MKKRQITTYAKQVTNYCQKFQAIAAAELSVQALKVHQKELNRRYSNLQTSFDEFLVEEEEHEEAIETTLEIK